MQLRLRTIRGARQPQPQPTVPPGEGTSPDPEFVEVPAEGSNPLRVWPKPAPTGYLGQLEGDFQKTVASWWDDVALSDCYFYHRVRLSDGRFIDGPWNLIGGENEYLGGIAVEGRRVLEFGPATGWLSAWLEQKGASVVGFDAGWDVCLDVLPLPHLDLEDIRRQTVDFLCRVQNAWWYLHRDLKLSARMVYGPIYDLPPDIGRYDISIFAAILTHLREPFRALEQAAMRTDEAMVVVEPFFADLGGAGSIARWNPSASTNQGVWWFHTPAAIVDMLTVLGFPDVTVSYNSQPYKIENTDGPHQDSPFFTVVARRAPTTGK